MKFKRYNSIIDTYWYLNNKRSYGHGFKEVQIRSNCIVLTDGYDFIKTVYYKPKTKIKELKAMATMLLTYGQIKE